MNSFIENVNYVASLDNRYGRNLNIYKNNLSLRTDNHDIEFTLSYYNFTTKEIVDNVVSYAGINISQFSNTLSNYKNHVIALLGGTKFTCSYTFNYTNFVINNVAEINIDISSLDDNIKLYGLKLNIKNNNVDVYNIYAKINDTLKILPSVALLDTAVITNIDTVADDILSINNVGTNIGSVNTVSTDIANINTNAANISSVNTVAGSILNVNNTGNNISSINNVSESIANVNTVSTSIANVDTVGNNIANVNITGSNILSVNTAATNISNINSVGNNITNLNSIAKTIVPNITEILLADNRAGEALQSANNADQSEYMANRWAVNPEDVPVVGSIGIDDQYSAYHWAKKAEALAGGTITLDSLHDVDTNGMLDGGTIIWSQSLGKYVSYDFAHNDAIGFDTTANVTVSEGQIAWNATEGTADLGLPGGSTLQIGQENIRTIRNATTSTITNGTLCMFDGTIGNSGRIKVKPFTAGFSEAIYLYGMATQDITPGSDGIITIEGKVRGINTTGSSVGEIWTNETILYAKPNDAGAMTNVVPADDELKLIVATVVHAHATNGVLEIRFMPFNENMYYTKVQNDILLNSKVPLDGNFTLDLGGI